MKFYIVILKIINIFEIIYIFIFTYQMSNLNKFDIDFLYIRIIYKIIKITDFFKFKVENDQG